MPLSQALNHRPTPYVYQNRTQLLPPKQPERTAIPSTTFPKSVRTDATDPQNLTRLTTCSSYRHSRVVYSCSDTTIVQTYLFVQQHALAWHIVSAVLARSCAHAARHRRGLLPPLPLPLGPPQRLHQLPQNVPVQAHVPRRPIRAAVGLGEHAAVPALDLLPARAARAAGSRWNGAVGQAWCSAW
jgi:hypothetical protein